MNKDEENRKAEALLTNLDPIIEEINQTLLSSKSIPNKRNEISLMLIKISEYKKLRKNHQKSHNVEMEVQSLASIFSGTENILKKISEGEGTAEYVDNGLFQKFIDISDRIKQQVR